MRARSSVAEALSSISFRLPHFGLWTHDGQPLVHGQPSSSRAVSPTQPAKLSKPALGDPDPARVAVVDEDGRAAGLEVQVRGETADVPAVAHRPERQERDQRVLRRVQGAEQLRHLLDPVEQVVAGAEPDGLGLEGRGRQHERHHGEGRAVADRLPLIGDHLLGDRDATEVKVDPCDARRAQCLLDRGLRVLLHLRVPVDAGGLDDRGARDVVELADEVLLSEMEVDGTVVDRRVGPLPLHEAEHRARRAVDDREGVLVTGAEREASGRRIAPLPDVPGGRALELRQQRRPLERLGAEGLGVRRADRPLVRRRVDVGVEDPRVRVIEPRRLDATFEERLGLAHEELVEGILARDQNGKPVTAPTGPAPLLAQGGDRAGKSDGDRAVELADVDPELEGVGGRDAEQLALHQAPLDLTALLGRVPGAVRGEPRRRGGVHAIGGEAVDQLGRLAALREADRAQPA